MNILIFAAREFNPVMGGIERVSSLLARFLVAHGHHVYFLAGIKTSDTIYQPEVEQFFLPDGGFKGSVANRNYVIELIQKFDIRLIINQTDFGFLFSRSYLPKQIKIISVIHNSYKSMNAALPNSYRRLRNRIGITYFLSRVGRMSDAIVLFSDKFAPEFKYFCKAPMDKKIVIIPNFNTYQQVTLNTEKKKEVLFVGRLFNGHKRVDRLLQIWKMVEEKHPLWSLYIVGEGEDKAMLENLSTNLALKNVHFEGTQNPADYYQRASIFCMTSSYESFGMVLTEAMQHGAIPIAFNSYAMASEIINSGIDGCLITPFSLEEYAKQLSVWMENEPLRKSIAKEARISVQRYSLENVGGKWLKLINELA